MTAAEFKEREMARWPGTNPAKGRDMSGVETLRKMRGVSEFAQFPEATKRVYWEVARCFPNVRVFACGSRVRGDYVDRGDYFFVKEARKQAGMKDKQESDFDFFIPDSRVEPTGKLPENAQRVRARVPAGELVEVPIWKKIETS